MRDEVVAELLDGLKRGGVQVLSFVPDTWLGAAEQRARSDPDFTVLQATNEAEGLSICGGAWLGGSRAALLMENTGFLVAVHNIEYVCRYYGIPVLMIMSYRGTRGDGLWWFTGLAKRLEPTLRAQEIAYEVVTQKDRLSQAVVDAVRTMENSKEPVVLLLAKELAE
jgi:sulfopyruvate decarboxylase subunit alpha